MLSLPDEDSLRGTVYNLDMLGDVSSEGTFVDAKDMN
jgi:hypothetical protein